MNSSKKSTVELLNFISGAGTSAEELLLGGGSLDDHVVAERLRNISLFQERFDKLRETLAEVENRTGTIHKVALRNKKEIVETKEELGDLFVEFDRIKNLKEKYEKRRKEISKVISTYSLTSEEMSVLSAPPTPESSAEYFKVVDKIHSVQKRLEERMTELDSDLVVEIKQEIKEMEAMAIKNVKAGIVKEANRLLGEYDTESLDSASIAGDGGSPNSIGDNLGREAIEFFRQGFYVLREFPESFREAEEAFIRYRKLFNRMNYLIKLSASYLKIDSAAFPTKYISSLLFYVYDSISEEKDHVVEIFGRVHDPRQITRQLMAIFLESLVLPLETNMKRIRASLADSFTILNMMILYVQMFANLLEVEKDKESERLFRQEFRDKFIKICLTDFYEKAAARTEAFSRAIAAEFYKKGQIGGPLLSFSSRQSLGTSLARIEKAFDRGILEDVETVAEIYANNIKDGVDPAAGYYDMDAVVERMLSRPVGDLFVLCRKVNSTAALIFFVNLLSKVKERLTNRLRGTPAAEIAYMRTLGTFLDKATTLLAERGEDVLSEINYVDARERLKEALRAAGGEAFP